MRQIERKNTKKTAATATNAFDSYSPYLLGLSPKNMLVPQGGTTPSPSASNMAMVMMMSNYADAQKSNEYLQAMSTSMMPKCPVQYNATPMMMPPMSSTMLPKPSLHGIQKSDNHTNGNATHSVPTVLVSYHMIVLNCKRRLYPQCQLSFLPALAAMMRVAALITVLLLVMSRRRRQLMWMILIQTCHLHMIKCSSHTNHRHRRRMKKSLLPRMSLLAISIVYLVVGEH